MSETTQALRSHPEPFVPGSTWLWAIAWLLVTIHGWGGLAGGDPAVWLNYPGSAAGQMIDRDLLIATAADPDRTGFVQQTLEYGADSLHEAVVALEAQPTSDELDRELELARVQLILLEAASSDLARTREIADRHPAPEALGLAEALADETASEMDLDASIRGLEALGVGVWLIGDARARAHELRGETAAAEAIESSLAQQGSHWLARSESLVRANSLLILAGCTVMVVAFVHSRGRLRIMESSARGMPPWSVATGLGVVVRGDFWARLYGVAILDLPVAVAESPLGAFLNDFATPISALPLIALTIRHLVLPAAAAAGHRVDPFGIAPSQWFRGSIAAAALAAIALELLGIQLFGTAAAELGLESSWAEGIDETLLWGSAAEVSHETLDLVLWGPLVEELTYRGLLFFSLRRVLGPWSASLASSGVFALIHFYSATGFAITFFSGLVWAIVFERTRSLIPGVVAHGIYNALYVASHLLVYR